MADIPARSMTGEMSQGMIDGSRKKANPNRGGIEEDTTAHARADLARDLYDYESDDSYPGTTALPDGTTYHNR